MTLRQYNINIKKPPYSHVNTAAIYGVLYKCKRNQRMNKLSEVCLSASVHGFTMPSLLFARNGEKISIFFYSTLYILYTNLLIY